MRTKTINKYDYLLTPIISDGERALILLQMARVCYTQWAIAGGIEPDWDELPPTEKDRWGQSVRASFRAMLSLVGEGLYKEK